MQAPGEAAAWLVPGQRCVGKYIHDGKTIGARVYPLEVEEQDQSCRVLALTPDASLGRGPDRRVWLGSAKPVVPRATEVLARDNRGRRVLLVGEGIEQAALIWPGRCLLAQGARVTAVLVAGRGKVAFAHRYLTDAALQWIFAVPGVATRNVIGELLDGQSFDTVWVSGPSRLRRTVMVVLSGL